VKVEPVSIASAHLEFLEGPKESGVPSQCTLYMAFECLARDEGLLRPADDAYEAAWVEASKVSSFLDEGESLLRSRELKRFPEAAARGPPS